MNEWKLTIRNRRGIVATSTHPDSATALHNALLIVCKYSAMRKHVSAFISCNGEFYEYHG